MRQDSKALVSSVACAAAIVAGAAMTVTADSSRATFHGVWRTTEVLVPGPTPQKFTPPSTLAIFQGTHYARVEVHAEQPRPLIKDPSSASAGELRAAWGPFVGEAGTFEVDGRTVTMQAFVAKNPADMNGARSVYTFERTGDTLTLTLVRTPASERPTAVVITLKRVE